MESMPVQPADSSATNRLIHLCNCPIIKIQMISIKRNSLVCRLILVAASALSFSQYVVYALHTMQSHYTHRSDGVEIVKLTMSIF